MASREADDAKAAQRSKLDAEAPRLRTHHAEVWINGHDPYAYLRDVLERLPTQAASRIGELLPHRWQPARPRPEVAARRQDGIATRCGCCFAD
jgi:hypothetical protein